MHCASIAATRKREILLIFFVVLGCSFWKPQIAFGIVVSVFFPILRTMDRQYIFFCDSTFFHRYYYYLLLRLNFFSIFIFCYLFIFWALTWQDTISYFSQWIYVAPFSIAIPVVLSTNYKCIPFYLQFAGIFLRALNEKKTKHTKQCPRSVMPSRRIVQVKWYHWSCHLFKQKSLFSKLCQIIQQKTL